MAMSKRDIEHLVKARDRLRELHEANTRLADSITANVDGVSQQRLIALLRRAETLRSDTLCDIEGVLFKEE